MSSIFDPTQQGGPSTGSNPPPADRQDTGQRENPPATGAASLEARFAELETKHKALEERYGESSKEAKKLNEEKQQLVQAVYQYDAALKAKSVPPPVTEEPDTAGEFYQGILAGDRGAITRTLENVEERAAKRAEERILTRATEQGQKGSRYQRLLNKYPELAKNESAFQKVAQKHYITEAQERQGMGIPLSADVGNLDLTVLEIATANAAAELSRAGGDAEAYRRANLATVEGAGAPASAPDPGKMPILTDEEKKKATKWGWTEQQYWDAIRPEHRALRIAMKRPVNSRGY